MELVWIVGLGALVAAGLAWAPAWTRRRRQRIAARPFPALWDAWLAQYVPLLARLDAAQQRALRQRIQVFVAEVPFIGCRGLEVSDAMRVVVAAQACLLLLGRPGAWFVGLRQVLLYPGPFRVQRKGVDEAGVHWDQEQELAGESWSEGQVVLSWPDCLHSAADPHDGYNVVVHEFAHQLDQEKGPANGAPVAVLGHKRWAQVWQQHYQALREQSQLLARGFAEVAPQDHLPLLDPYATQDPGEFFAVACEVFMERGGDLQRIYPALYAQLAAYLGLDTVPWSRPEPAHATALAP
ncbi:MAG: zinc-dependent peptidase [Rhodoferax sp.]